MTTSVLFVCLGNICRSPMAEAALRQECARAGKTMIIDSAGIRDWHTGNPPDDRAQAVAARYGAPIDHLSARPVRVADFRTFDHIIAMDNDNLSNLKSMAPSDGSAKLSLFLDLLEGRNGQDVIDPYYEADEAFETTWADVVAGAKALIAKLS
ncbi:low molecular weight protein-tyrosine-phosphatase [Parasphingorhabdus sp. JC815]|uniref:low molecular weight protein-tyrosine-phosphatase n=1 Tax=Parasphingorhabdus sp. JC815 TaxID=3232140 RepID=UPI00345AE76E